MKSEAKKTAKKELETSITEKFMSALSELGHDVTKLKREIKKASKFVSKKIERKFKDVKTVIGDKLESQPVKEAVQKASKSTATAKKDVIKKAVKVEKVIAKATKIAQKKISKPVEEMTEHISSAISDTRAAVAKPAKKSAAKIVDAEALTEAEPIVSAALTKKPKKAVADTEKTVD